MKLLLMLLIACKKPVPTEAAAPTPDPGPTSVAASAAPWPVGHWKGALALPGGLELTLVVHVTHGEDGFSATLDSPDQGAMGIPIRAVTVDGDHVVLDVEAIRGELVADRSGEDLVGTWTQGGGSLPITLVATEDAGPRKRPQDPVPPFPYVVEEVEIPSVPGVTLAGTLTRPEGTGPFPAVVLLTGSGPQDRDEALLGHRPFAVLADHLTRAGIAVLRTDDRGFGASTGTFATARTPDFADDAAHALAWLDARADTGPTGLVGHSEGGLVAPIVQARTEPDAPHADFLVLLAGPAVSGAAILEEQGARIAAASGVSADEVELQRAQSRAAIQAAIDGADLQGLMKAVRAVPGSDAATDAELKPALTPLTTPWFRWFLAFDPTDTLKRVDVPVLALFGEKDLQVPADQSEGPMRDALGERGTVEVLPGLNHLFQPASTGAPAEYAGIDITMDPVMLDRVASWILEVSRE
ncbi:MAG: alpha/beta hydrolase [Myxococcota bacterium]